MEYIDLCKAVKRQRQLKELKEDTLETLQKLVGDEETAKRVYDYLQNSKEGYIRYVGYGHREVKNMKVGHSSSQKDFRFTLTRP